MLEENYEEGLPFLIDDLSKNFYLHWILSFNQRVLIHHGNLPLDIHEGNRGGGDSRSPSSIPVGGFSVRLFREK